MKKLDPTLSRLSEEEVGKIREKYYEIAQFAFDVWAQEQQPE